MPMPPMGGMMSAGPGIMMMPMRQPPLMVPTRPPFPVSAPQPPMPGYMPPPPQPPPPGPMPMKHPGDMSMMDDEPPNKKIRTEESLMPEEKFLAKYKSNTPLSSAGGVLSTRASGCLKQRVEPKLGDSCFSLAMKPLHLPVIAEVNCEPSVSTKEVTGLLYIFTGFETRQTSSGQLSYDSQLACSVLGLAAHVGLTSAQSIDDLNDQCVTRKGRLRTTDLAIASQRLCLRVPRYS
uniref:(California timema) hypothetical protein n=1 Tax=Timema californicum TaxID=61474 RepID=A0A7R9JKM3_TIMCA|nr:unnamed protein product [Timema californicum]